MKNNKYRIVVPALAALIALGWVGFQKPSFALSSNAFAPFADDPSPSLQAQQKKAAFQLGLCGGQTLAREGIYLPVDRNTPYSTELKTALRAAVEHCKDLIDKPKPKPKPTPKPMPSSTPIPTMTPTPMPTVIPLPTETPCPSPSPNQSPAPTPTESATPVPGESPAP